MPSMAWLSSMTSHTGCKESSDGSCAAQKIKLVLIMTMILMLERAMNCMSYDSVEVKNDKSNLMQLTMNMKDY